MTIDSGLAALLGALIGSIGGVVSQYTTQYLIDRNDDNTRARREARTLEAFRGMLRSYRALIVAYFGRERLPSIVAMKTAIAPLRDAIAQPDLFLDLNPDQIRTLFRIVTFSHRLEIMIDPSIDNVFVSNEGETSEATISDILGTMLDHCNEAADAFSLDIITREDAKTLAQS